MTDHVAPEVWSEAQQWESRFWIREQHQLAKYGKNLAWKALSTFGLMDRYRGDDHNRSFWMQQFDGYKFLPPEAENAIEVGCGPYTNMRIIREVCSFRHLVLSDPLIRTYVKFKRTFVHEMYRTLGCVLDAHPLEQLPYRDEYFDVAVMINVLDHVQDARACMENLVRILRPGGYLVIGQELSNSNDLTTHPNGLTVGHPITLDAEWFRPYLSQFTPVLDRVLSREEGRHPQWHYGTMIFAGRKR